MPCESHNGRLLASSKNLRHIDLLKMDIQGGEYEALHGATELLANGAIDLIYSEAFFVPMYANQPLFGDLVSYLAKWNYRLHLIYNQNINGISGRPFKRILSLSRHNCKSPL
jgi:hypothetical protein